ncbi:Protein transport protein sec20 [Malassezia furfur]|uniref:Protein transport protein sec20 n=1 Tax=Malassezia furfur TaxID=55194 RepID=A0ABY8EVB3_MALFU|nr:Protein transport protein sec20 [Malassezia furfur]
MAAPALPRDVRTARDAAARRVRDVRDVQLPRIHAATAHAELADAEAELHATVQRIAALVADVADAADEGTSDEETAALRRAAREDRTALDALRRDTRAALLAGHRRVQSAAESAARASLQLGTPRTPRAPPTHGAARDRAQTTSEDVTAALQRTVALMSSELEKSGYSAQLLEESSEGLAQISTAYASFGALLHDSIDLIRQMERAELWDYAVLVASLSFFVGCVAYILYVRVLSRGLSLVSLAWRATSLVRRSPVPSAVAAASAHTSSLAAAAAAASASALRRSPAGAPRKVLHRDDPVADATRHLADTPTPSAAAWAPSRPRGPCAASRRGATPRRSATPRSRRTPWPSAHSRARRPARRAHAPRTSPT